MALFGRSLSIFCLCEFHVVAFRFGAPASAEKAEGGISRRLLQGFYKGLYRVFMGLAKGSGDVLSGVTMRPSFSYNSSLCTDNMLTTSLIP